tara:strand:+ start:354 stop:533 length:180 start_codon:yes stop_codon:yes gene_type:complete
LITLNNMKKISKSYQQSEKEINAPFMLRKGLSIIKRSEGSPKKKPTKGAFGNKSNKKAK